MAGLPPRRAALTRREQQVVEVLAVGGNLADVALRLRIPEPSAAEYLTSAKLSLRVTEIPAAVAVAYATDTVQQPVRLDPGGLFLTPGQAELVPLIVRGLDPSRMAEELKRSTPQVRSDGRELMSRLGAVNPAHTVLCAWRFRLFTAKQVLTWLP